MRHEDVEEVRKQALEKLRSNTVIYKVNELSVAEGSREPLVYAYFRAPQVLYLLENKMSVDAGTMIQAPSNGPATFNAPEKESSGSVEGGAENPLATEPPSSRLNVLGKDAVHGLTDQTNYLSARRIVVVYLALALALGLTFLDGTIVATALPRISDDLHAGTESAWVVSAYLLTKYASLKMAY